MYKPKNHTTLIDALILAEPIPDSPYKVEYLVDCLKIVRDYIRTHKVEINNYLETYGEGECDQKK